MGPAVRHAALLALPVLVIAVDLMAALVAVGSPSSSWIAAAATYPDDLAGGNLTATLARTRRVAVYSQRPQGPPGLHDDDDDDALLAALHRIHEAQASKRPPRTNPPMHKVLLTQMGYIQFLRYTVDVPELRELSFCLWMRSRNLTHNHPVFSYSKNENERIVRAWVSPGGARLPPRVHLMVMERPVFVEPLPEAAHKRWLHVCASWDGQSGRYRLYVDGRVRRAGVRHEVAGLTLPGGGDIVVGQEYTDFDKGLDDGIEGEVFGFYLFRTATPRTAPAAVHPSESEHDFDEDHQRQLLRTRRWGAFQDDDDDEEDVVVTPRWRLSSTRYQRRRSGDDADALLTAHRAKRVPAGWPFSPPPGPHGPHVPQRVRRLYALCTEPLTPEDKAEAVVSWPNTAVRVFGGAMISNVRKGCGDF